MQATRRAKQRTANKKTKPSGNQTNPNQQAQAKLGILFEAIHLPSHVETESIPSFFLLQLIWQVSRSASQRTYAATHGQCSKPGRQKCTMRSEHFTGLTCTRVGTWYCRTRHPNIDLLPTKFLWVRGFPGVKTSLSEFPGFCPGTCAKKWIVSLSSSRLKLGCLHLQTVV